MLPKTRVSDLVLLLLPALSLPVGCSTPVRLSDLAQDAPVDVRLDANARTHEPGRKIKFFVDITNRGEGSIDLTDLRIEIQAHAPAGKVHLRKEWPYDWGDRRMVIGPGKRITVPVVPGISEEFPLDQLAEGTYELVAVVNGLFISRPYTLKVLRPDLTPAVRVR